MGLPARYVDAITDMYTNRSGEVNQDAVDEVLAIADKDPIGFMSGYGLNDQGQMVNNRTGGVIASFDERALSNGFLTPIEQLGTYPVQERPEEVIEASFEDSGHGLPVGKQAGQGVIEI